MVIRKTQRKRTRYGIRMLAPGKDYEVRHMVNGKLVPVKDSNRPYMDIPPKTGSKGSLSFRPVDNNPKHIEITGMFVPIHNRGKGHGGDLLDAFIEKGGKIGVKSMLASTSAKIEQEAARRLLESRGFEEIGRDRDSAKEIINYMKKL